MLRQHTFKVLCQKHYIPSPDLLAEHKVLQRHAAAQDLGELAHHVRLHLQPDSRLVECGMCGCVARSVMLSYEGVLKGVHTPHARVHALLHACVCREAVQYSPALSQAHIKHGAIHAHPIQLIAHSTTCDATKQECHSTPGAAACLRQVTRREQQAQAPLQQLHHSWAAVTTHGLNALQRGMAGRRVRRRTKGGTRTETSMVTAGKCDTFHSTRAHGEQDVGAIEYS